MSTSPSPDPSTKGLSPWLLLMIAVIGPPVALIPFVHTITQNPLLIAPIVLAYAAIVLIAGFASKVWQKLESNYSGGGLQKLIY